MDVNVKFTGTGRFEPKRGLRVWVQFSLLSQQAMSKPADQSHRQQVFSTGPSINALFIQTEDSLPGFVVATGWKQRVLKDLCIAELIQILKGRPSYWGRDMQFTTEENER